MKKFHGVRKDRKKLFFNAAASLTFVAACACTLLASTPTQAPQQQQSTTTAAPTYQFETASIKPTKSDQDNFRPGFTVDGYRAPPIPVKYLIQEAYGVQDYQLSGVSDWLKSEEYEIEAKMDQSVADALSKLPPAELRLARQQMLQALLAERFNLKIHRETKDAPVYFLTIGKNGPKLQDAKTRRDAVFQNADGTLAPGHIQLGPEPGGGGVYQARAFSFSMKSFGDWLAMEVHRPVIDKTALTGIYDFTLEWMPDTNASTPAPDAQSAVTLPGAPAASIFTALQQQLGLKLEPGKSPIDVIVIDHVERPSGN